MPLFLSLDNICRACLSEGDLKSIFDGKSDDWSVSFAEMFTECTAIHVTKDDSYPRNLCSNCLAKLTEAYSFREQCKKSHETLQWSDIKTDIDDNNDEPFESSESNRTDTVRKRPRKPPDSERVGRTRKRSVKVTSTSCDDSNDEPLESYRIGKIRKRNTSPYTCSKCDVTFDSSAELSKHLKSTQHKHRRDLQCGICSKSFSKSQLKFHMRTHTQEKPFSCDVCHREFSLKCNLRRHMMTHTGQRPYQCHVCNKGFIQYDVLINHLRGHTGETPYACATCGKAFKMAQSLRLHEKIHERARTTGDGRRHDYSGEERRYKCDQCQRGYPSKHGLNAHLRTHGDKKYLCSHCGKGFVSSALLYSHNKVHTGEKPHHCSVCGKSFSQVGALKTHSLLHTGEKPFSCSQCDKTFTQRHHLKYHLRTHSGEKPYACSVCGKCFSMNCNLKIHMRQHSGEQPYKCPVCDKGFYDSSSMKKHRKGHGHLWAETEGNEEDNQDIS